jgi:hypothetical protein
MHTFSSKITFFFVIAVIMACVFLIVIFHDSKFLIQI